MSNTSKSDFFGSILDSLRDGIDIAGEFGSITKSIQEADVNDEVAVNNVFSKLNDCLEAADEFVRKTKKSYSESREKWRLSKSSEKTSVNSTVEVPTPSAVVVEKQAVVDPKEVECRETGACSDADEVKENSADNNQENKANHAHKVEEDDVKPKIGSINLVDIRKLLDPGIVKKTQTTDNSVIILSDSDHEAVLQKTNKPKRNNERNAATRVTRTRAKPVDWNQLRENRAARKNKEALVLSCSDEETASTKNIRTKNLENGKKRNVRKDLQSGSESESKGGDKGQLKKHKGTDKSQSTACLRQVTIPLPRIPCEKLKEYYTEQAKMKKSERAKVKKRRTSDQQTTEARRKRQKQVDSESNSIDKNEKGLLNTDASELSDENNPRLPGNEAGSSKSTEKVLENKETTEKKTDEINTESDTETIIADEQLSSNNIDKDAKKNQEDEDSDDDTPSKRSARADANETKDVAKASSRKSGRSSSFEVNDSDSDDSVIEVKKKKKKNSHRRVILNSDSDTADEGKGARDANKSDSDESEADKSSRTKKLKRIKRIEGSSSEDDENGKGNKDKDTRKQIRKVLTKEKLTESTKRAEKEENERKARILEKQKKYNQLYDLDLSSKAKVEKVVLDYDEQTKKELLKVDDELLPVLKPHQASGIQFMWDACFESLKRAKEGPGSGCILAHCMGLGKTLQVIVLCHTLLMNREETGVNRILVVCPLSTVLNWVAEFSKWLPESTADDIEIYELVSQKQNSVREYRIVEWYKHGGILIMGYDMFRNLSNPQNKRMSKKMRAKFQMALADPGPDLVVCDEGHLLKNEKTSISISMNRLKTLRRIVLTGTPLQNNLREYFCMVQFVKPNLLGTYKEYLNRFVNPITNGQYTDSTPFDIQLMRKRSHVLHKMLDGVVQRRDYSVLAPYLPPKHEYVVFVSLTDTQLKLYRYYMENFARKPIEDSGKVRPTSLFADFQELQRICTHPRVLLDKSIIDKNAKEKWDEEDEESEGSLKDFIDDGEDEDSKESGSGSDQSAASSNSDGGRNNKRVRVTRSNAALAGGIDEVNRVIDEVREAGEPEWWETFCEDGVLEDIKSSGKMTLLFEILKECENIGDKLLIFSQSLYSLNAIEYFLRKVDEATQNGDTETVGGFSGSWALGLDYFRLDGSSSCDNRSAWCKTFNDPDNIRARLFLISTRAGGLGINLFAANRVIIFDVSWNPSHDIQSIYRVYRFGQTKPCYIYRFVTMGTMEMKIYERQVIKQAISKRVIDEQQIDRHYNQNDLAELYKFDPKPDGERPTPLVPKDVLLAELVQNLKDTVYKYHEHHTLLENKEDEVLDEAERKAAWEEYENEKNRRYEVSSAPKGSFYGIPTGTVVAALSSILRRDNPTWTAQQINRLTPSLLVQVSEQMQNSNTTMYNRIVQEVRKMQQLQAQKMQMYYMQQQQLMMQQYQQQQLQQMNANYSLPTNQEDLLRALMRSKMAMPGTSVQPNVSNSNDVIDLND